MRLVLGNRTAVFDSAGRKLRISKEGFSVEGKKPYALSFSEVSYINTLRYCNSNMGYSLFFQNEEGKNLPVPGYGS